MRVDVSVSSSRRTLCWHSEGEPPRRPHLPGQRARERPVSQYSRGGTARILGARDGIVFRSRKGEADRCRARFLRARA